MTGNQKQAYINIKHAANALIGGIENITYDYPEDSEAYKEAVRRLNDHDGLVKELYITATTEIHRDGFCCFDKRACAQELRNINFCGKDWLMEQCEKRITEEGY